MRFLLSHPIALLADDMGLGKTVQVAKALQHLHLGGVIRRSLVISPVSLCLNWQSELSRWAPELPSVIYQGADRFGLLRGRARLLIASYDTVARDLSRESQDGADFVDLGIDLLVLDEAQNIKAQDSSRARVLSSILAPRRWALTGTPMENHPRELASILHFLYPNELSEAHDLVRDSADIMRLRDATMLRRTKTEVALQLPQKTVGYVAIEMTPSQQAEYFQHVAHLKRLFSSSMIPTVPQHTLIGHIQKLRRLASIASDGSSGKVDFLAEELSALGDADEKAVVFSSFPNLLFPTLAQKIPHLSPVLLTGSSRAEERDQSHSRFTRDETCKVMLASLSAGGVGYTWTVAHHGYHTDIWWNPQLMRQAEDRLHRIGQKSHVLVKRLFSAGTIEDGIRNMLTTKEEIFDFLIEGSDRSNMQGVALDRLLEMAGIR